MVYRTENLQKWRYYKILALIIVLCKYHFFAKKLRIEVSLLTIIHRMKQFKDAAMDI